MEGKMRSVLVTASNQVSYCFYGSKRHMMMDIFNNSSNPFIVSDKYCSCKDREREWNPFIVNAFHRTDKEINEQNKPDVYATS